MREGMKDRFPIKNVGNDKEGRGVNDGVIGKGTITLDGQASGLDRLGYHR